MHDSMTVNLLVHRMCGNIRDFFHFTRSEEIEPVAKRISAFMKDLESEAVDQAEKKRLHDAVNAFNKALTAK